MTFDELEAEVTRLREQVDELAVAKDTLDIWKLQSRYSHLYHVGRRRDVPALFARKTPGVTLEMEDSGVYEGLESVTRFWNTVFDDTKIGAGHLAVHMTVNPVIEINADRTRAKGLWHSHGYCSFAVEGVFKQFLRQEELPTGRLRIGLLIGSLYFALGFALVRTLDGIALLLNWTSPLTKLAWALGDSLIAVCILGFALAFAPLRWLGVLARIFMYLEQQRTRRDLEKLRLQLVRLTAPPPWPQPKWRERWFQPSYAIYCILIDILDRRSFLLADLQNANGRAALPAALDPLLADLPETDDWIGLLQHVRQIARGTSSSSGLVER